MSYHIISYHIISYHISYIIYHISHITFHISYIIYHVSCIIYHISHITFHISYIIYHVSHITFHISDIIYHISHITFHISYVIYHISYHITSCDSRDGISTLGNDVFDGTAPLSSPPRNIFPAPTEVQMFFQPWSHSKKHRLAMAVFFQTYFDYFSLLRMWVMRFEATLHICVQEKFFWSMPDVPASYHDWGGEVVNPGVPGSQKSPETTLALLQFNLKDLMFWPVETCTARKKMWFSSSAEFILMLGAQ